MNTIATAEQRESTKPGHSELFPRIRTIMSVKSHKNHLLGTAGPDMEEYMAFHAMQAMYHWMGNNPTVRSMERIRRLSTGRDISGDMTVTNNKTIEPVSH